LNLPVPQPTDLWDNLSQLAGRGTICLHRILFSLPVVFSYQVLTDRASGAMRASMKAVKAIQSAETKIRSDQPMTRKQCQSAAWGKRLLMLTAVMLSSCLAVAGSPKMSKDLEGKNPSDLVDVIVQFKQAPTQMHFSKVQGRGGLLRRQLGVVKGGAFRLPASALKELAKATVIAVYGEN
jgi:hypothetical protein